MILGPGVNVHRTAYGGRNFEYLSGEDRETPARMCGGAERGARVISRGEGSRAVF